MNQTVELSSPQMKNKFAVPLSRTRRDYAHLHQYLLKEACIICQSREGTLQKVEFESTGEKMLDIAKKLVDSSLFFRLNTIPNASDAKANKCSISFGMLR